MLKLIYSILSICLTLFSSAQGSWDIGYVPVDSLNKGHIGRIVRLDFKTPKKFSGAQSTRSYLGRTDTGIITIDTAILTVVERRKISVDNGSYNDQYLECLSCKGLNLKLYDAEILDVDDKSIIFKIEIHSSLKDSVRSGRSIKVVQVERNKLDGVMYQLSKT